MPAYAAVISLKNTIKRIGESSIFSLVPPSEEIIIPVFEELNSLQNVLERLDRSSISKSRKRVNSLDEKIKDVVWKLEDALESHLTDQIISQSESSRDIQRRRKKKKEEEEEEEDEETEHFCHPFCSCNVVPHKGERDLLLFSIDLKGLRHDVAAFIYMVEKLKLKYMDELSNLPEEKEDEESIISSRNEFGGTKSKMVGLCDIFEQVKSYLTGSRRHVSLVGMAGIGKTTLAREVFEDPLILSHFKNRVWIKVGRKSKFNEIRQLIIAQVEQTDHKIVENFEERFRGENCLIVLDDVWDANALDDCLRYLPSMFQILLTSRELIFATCIYRWRNRLIQVMRFLSEDESKDLLCEKVFGEKDFPPQLEKAGKEIAHYCDGLPLMIVTIADYLSKAEKTPEFWNEVALRRNSVFEDAYNDISKVLFPTYDYLPQSLKMLFLYLGAFPRDYEIPRSRLVNIVTAEGFLDCIREITEEFLISYLNKLDTWKNIVITSQKSQSWYMKIANGIKTCRLHSSWQHLCKAEAQKNKFFRILSSRVDGVEGQRRLCVHINSTLCINEAYNSANCASTARSLLCFGPYHRYPVPIDVGFKLLRVLDALKVRFYQFPIEILKLVHLQYLSLTCNKELPASISKLFNLQFLIIHPHLNIKSCGVPLLLPIQIWDMQELKHIEIMGSCLQDPTHVASLEKLFTLLGVSTSSCTKEVFQKIPNIRKLGIQVERLPNHDGNPFSCFCHISQLKNLDILKCDIVNPKFEPEFIVPLPSFPSSLRKLHLSGLGYPWECMNVIGSLPNLQVLKLRCYAFRGPRWETETGSFLKLEFLLIQDTDLVKWEPKPRSFPRLNHLVMKNCYKLKELIFPETAFGVPRIELVDCHPLADTFVKQLKSGTNLKIVASFGDGELKR